MQFYVPLSSMWIYFQNFGQNFQKIKFFQKCQKTCFFDFKGQKSVFFKKSNFLKMSKNVFFQFLRVKKRFFSKNQIAEP